ncbi:MAG: hypothetical protein ACO3GW_08720 [Vulcanococcus sp.]
MIDLQNALVKHFGAYALCGHDADDATDDLSILISNADGLEDLLNAIDENAAMLLDMEGEEA